jgi:hypothetical protein
MFLIPPERLNHLLLIFTFGREICIGVIEEPTRISIGTNPLSLPYIHNKFRDMIGTEYAFELQLIGETNKQEFWYKVIYTARFVPKDFQI